jgi:hypothetical protein
MEAAQSRAAQSGPVTTRCNNTLSRLEHHMFIGIFLQFCALIENICDDYLGRGRSPILHHAIYTYIQQHSELANNDAMVQLGKDFISRLTVFIEHVMLLRRIVGRMSIMVNHTGCASFLVELSANPLCIYILNQMECTTMMVGGQITAFKTITGQECWRNGKLNTFFANLASHLKTTFASFHVVSISEINLRGQILDMKVAIINDPKFGKEDLSAEDRIMQEIFQGILANLPPAGTKQLPGA